MILRGGETFGPRVRAVLASAMIAVSSVALPSVAQAASDQVTQLGVTTPASVNQGEYTTGITIETQNAAGMAEPMTESGTRLYVSSTSSTGAFYVNTSGSNPITSDGVAVANNTARRTVYYHDTTPGSSTLTFTVRGGGLVGEYSTTRQLTVVDTSPVDTSKIVFTAAGVYRQRTTSVELQADPRATAVRFSASGLPVTGEQRITGQEATHTTWQPTANPAVGSVLSAEVQVAGTWYQASNTVTLYDAPALALESYSGSRGGSSLMVRGSVTEPIATTVVAQLVRLDGSVVVQQTVTARGATGDLTQFGLSGVATGDYRVVLVASDESGELARVSIPVAINTDIPRVQGYTVTSPAYAGRALTITGATSAPADSSAVLLIADQQIPLGLGADGTFGYTFSNGLPAGDYSFTVALTDSLGNTNSGAQTPGEMGQVSVVPAPIVPPVTITPPRVVTPGGDGSIPALEIDPVDALSTQFSIPVASNIVSASKRQVVFGSAQQARSVDIDSPEVQTLEKVVDLSVDRPPETPLAPTSGGWSLFGVAWYWWAAGVAAMWAAGMGVYRWLRRA